MKEDHYFNEIKLLKGMYIKSYSRHAQITPSLPGFPKLNLLTTSILLASTCNTSLLHLNPATVIANSTSLLKSGKFSLTSSIISADHPFAAGRLTSTTSKSCNLENNRSI